MANLSFPEMPRTRTVVQIVPEHEILLDFGDDEMAEKFSDWLSTSGWPAFTAWLAEMKHDIEHHEGSS
jgi:hypothetical protein